MSDSYRKHNFYNWYGRNNIKTWRTQENRRLRHNAKQLINTCLDYDELIIPVLNDFDTPWGSPRDGKLYYKPLPLLNECEVALHEAQHEIGRWGIHRGGRLSEEYKKNGGHLDNCECYHNKRSFYWKMSRK